MKSRKQEEMQSLILAIVVSVVVMAGWQYYVEAPKQKAYMQAVKAEAVQHAAQQPQLKAEPQQEVSMPREDRLKDSARVTIHSDRLHGSIALKGLRFDDLTLAKYHETTDPKSPEVTLFSPAGGEDSYFAEIGWLADNTTTVLPDAQTVWTTDNSTLTPKQPLTLHWKNPQGVQFLVHIALDENYMFTLTQSATDAAGKKLALRSYAYVNRVYDVKKHAAINILHEGPLGVFDSTLNEVSYKKLADAKTEEPKYETQAGGWLGITDKYWLAALVPDTQNFTADFSYYVSKDRGHYQTEYVTPAQELSTLHLFAGAKELSLLDSYADQYHIPLFDRAVDFGWFYFLTKPIFLALTYIHALIGNFGISILVLTVIVKLLMFPLANKSFRSMSMMKTLGPKMQQIRDLYKDDKTKVNQEIMELYKREKVNPAAGCLPMVVQIPVFFSLYKVLYVTIEMRQTPFFGWIHDLSVADPTNIFTLFGLLHWNPPGLLHLGLWPLIMCATMVIQQYQSPPPPDPTQAKMMKMMPFFMLFLFGSFPAGLVIYWSWSNTLTILQQWYFIRTHRTDVTVPKQEKTLRKRR